MKQHVVVIPIYKPSLEWFETISLRQVCKVLGKHAICIVTHDGIDLTAYQRIADEYHVRLLREDFRREDFISVKAYSDLMLNKAFYYRFAQYDYMLIYQLDAYVFRDELDEWCNKGYDYIGAPWFENYGNHEAGCGLWAVGNGGFSLRNIAFHIQFLECKRLYGWKELKVKYPKRDLKTFLVRLTHWLGYWQSTSCLLKETGDNEDHFFSQKAQLTRCKSSLPSPEEASRFAFEQSPSWLYSVNQQLPFGCHAWQKYEYESFWKQFIHDNDEH